MCVQLREPFPTSFRVAIIADLDKRSKRKDAGGKDVWHSRYVTATLTRTGSAYALQWDAEAEVETAHNEAGRGCELSELVLFEGKLFTFDDRTGIMFEVVHPASSAATGLQAPGIVPRNIFMEGDGNTDKGFKIEWATVKDGDLYVGSFGKEFTDNAGNIAHSNNLWVKRVKPDGTVHHLDWKPHYDTMRAKLGYPHPEYVLTGATPARAARACVPVCVRPVRPHAPRACPARMDACPSPSRVQLPAA
ncbi:hypothetical protein EON67_12245 [archaeon]|nr:MAG: hypothetical protein EON67_12245 [archaeon]